MTSKTVSKPSQKQKRISCTGKGGEADSTPQIPGDLTAIVQDFHGHFLQIGDRVQGAWVAGAGYRGVIESFSGRKKIIAHGTWIEGRRAGDGDRFSVSARMLIRLPEEGWNESEEGQNFWDRFELLKPYLSKANLETGYFDRSLDYPQSFEWLEVLEGKRQLTLPLDTVCQSLQSAALATGFPICELTIVTTDPTPEEQISAIRREGPIAPDGCWIETGKIKGKEFRQAWYRSRSPCFPPIRGSTQVKSRYLGVAGGDKHREAKKAIERREKIRKLKKQIKTCEVT
jgi:hypothetical protein